MVVVGVVVVTRELGVDGVTTMYIGGVTQCIYVYIVYTYCGVWGFIDE